MKFKTSIVALLALSLVGPVALASHDTDPNTPEIITNVYAFSNTGQPMAQIYVDWSGISGPDHDGATGGSCFLIDNGNTTGHARYGTIPPVVAKVDHQETTLIGDGEGGVQSAEVTQLCKMTVELTPVIGFCHQTLGQPEVDPNCHTYSNEPQWVGIGETKARLVQHFYPVANFDTKWQSTGNPTLVSCQVDAGSASFESTRNQGLAGNEPVMPAEKLVGTVDAGTCVDQSSFLVDQYAAGTINQDGALQHSVPISRGDGDMGPGLWAVCIASTIRDNVGNTIGVESDSSWFWIDSGANGFALAGLWSNPATWDNDGYTAASHPNDCADLGFPI